MKKLHAENETNTKLSALQLLQYTVLIIAILYFGKTLFIPLSFSMLISFTLFPICKWLENKGLSKSFAIAISISGLTILIGFLIFLLFKQIIAFSNEWQKFSVKLTETATEFGVFLAERFEISAESQKNFIKNSINNSSSEALSFLQNTVSSFSASMFSLMILPIFTALILFHRHLLANALYQIFPSEKKQMIHEILVESIHEFYNFIKGMALVYLIVGILNSIGLAIIGVPYPILFGFIASILTFIPYVGILISSLLPIAVAWITYNSIWYPLGVILVFSVVQILEGNIIFPLAVGNRLKINTLVIVVMIILGGLIWGTAGMILFIPFISIIKLIADRTESLKTLSILLGSG